MGKVVKKKPKRLTSYSTYANVPVTRNESALLHLVTQYQNTSRLIEDPSVFGVLYKGLTNNPNRVITRQMVEVPLNNNFEYLNSKPYSKNFNKGTKKSMKRKINDAGILTPSFSLKSKVNSKLKQNVATKTNKHRNPKSTQTSKAKLSVKKSTTVSKRYHNKTNKPTNNPVTNSYKFVPQSRSNRLSKKKLIEDTNRITYPYCNYDRNETGRIMNVERIEEHMMQENVCNKKGYSTDSKRKRAASCENYEETSWIDCMMSFFT